MRRVNGYDMEKFNTLNSSERTIAIQGDRWWPQVAKQKGDRIIKQFYVICGRSVLSAQMLEVSLPGVGTVLRLQRGAWPMVK